MTIFGLWLTLMTAGRVLRALDAMNNLGLSMASKIMGCELRALDTMNNSVLWMT